MSITVDHGNIARLRRVLDSQPSAPDNFRAETSSARGTSHSTAVRDYREAWKRIADIGEEKVLLDDLDDLELAYVLDAAHAEEDEAGQSVDDVVYDIVTGRKRYTAPDRPSAPVKTRYKEPNPDAPAAAPVASRTSKTAREPRKKCRKVNRMIYRLRTSETAVKEAADTAGELQNGAESHGKLKRIAEEIIAEKDAVRALCVDGSEE